MEGNVEERDLRVPAEAGGKSIWVLEVVPFHTLAITTHLIIYTVARVRRVLQMTTVLFITMVTDDRITLIAAVATLLKKPAFVSCHLS